MKLAPKDGMILSALNLDSELPAKTLRKRTGLRDHTIYYRRRRLEEAGVLRRGAFINFPALGLEQYEVFFSLSRARASVRRELLQHLRKSNRVFWLAELGGDYQYGMSLYAKNTREISSFLESLATKFGSVFAKKAFAVISGFTMFRKKYLAPSVPITAADALSITPETATVELDATDFKIIAALFGPESISHHAIARALGIPRPTVDYRMRRLVDRGVVLKQINFISAAKVGRLTYKLLIYVRGIQPALRNKLYQFALQEKSAVLFIEYLGNWDYEIVVEVIEPRDAVEVSERMLDSFGELINDVQVLPVFQQTTSLNFLKEV